MDRQTRGCELYAFLEEKVIAAMIHRLGASQHEVAVDVAHEVCDELVFEWGGQTLYIPRALLARQSSRNEAILSEFNGRNSALIAKKHNLSEMRIYQIVQAMRTKRRAGVTA